MKTIGLINDVAYKISYCLVYLLCRSIVAIYYKDVRLIGRERIPLEGPTLFVSNHFNKFVDAILMIALIDRQLSFLIAEVTLNRGFVGFCARHINAIGVKRREDCYTSGVGVVRKFISDEYEIDQMLEQHNATERASELLNEVTSSSFGRTNARKPVSSTSSPLHQDLGSADQLSSHQRSDASNVSPTVFGNELRRVVVEIEDGGQFVQTLTTRSSIQIQGIRLVVVLSLSDTSVLCTISQKKITALQALECPLDYSVVAYHSQDAMYERAVQHLIDRKSICIFPEGGSHDRPNLLPLKPGVAIIALSAAAAGVNNILIVPCGLHYFNRERFGSQAAVEIGKPLSIKPQYVEMYKNVNPALAVKLLMQDIKDALEDCIVSGSDYEFVNRVAAASTLFIPCRNRVSTQELHTLQCSFSRVFKQMESVPETKELMKTLQNYIDLLSYNGINDDEIEAIDTTRSNVLLLLIKYALLWLLTLIICLPSMPILYAFRFWLHRSADDYRNSCKRNSKVKIKATDVLASYKIVWFLVVLPIVNTLCSAFAGMLAYYFGYSIIRVVLASLLLTPFLGYVFLRLENSLSYLALKTRSCYYIYLLSINFSNAELLYSVRERLKTKMAVRNYIRLITSDQFIEAHLEHAEVLRKFKYILESVMPEVILQSDTDRIELTCKHITTPLDNLRVFSYEEIM